MSKTISIETVVARWTDPGARPLFKGRLIDDDGCCCAQGDVLRLSGWSDAKLRSTEQIEADREVAKTLGISMAHSVLLRQQNDAVDGCPQDVLAHPERILGDQALRVLTFWRHLDSIDWTTIVINISEAALGAAGKAAGKAAENAAWEVAWKAARYEAEEVPQCAAWATNEIQGAEKLSKFFFLPIFGFATPYHII